MILSSSGFFPEAAAVSSRLGAHTISQQAAAPLVRACMYLDAGKGGAGSRSCGQQHSGDLSVEPSKREKREDRETIFGAIWVHRRCVLLRRRLCLAQLPRRGGKRLLDTVPRVSVSFVCKDSCM